MKTTKIDARLTALFHEFAASVDKLNLGGDYIYVSRYRDGEWCIGFDMREKFKSRKGRRTHRAA